MKALVVCDPDLASKAWEAIKEMRLNGHAYICKNDLPAAQFDRVLRDYRDAFFLLLFMEGSGHVSDTRKQNVSNAVRWAEVHEGSRVALCLSNDMDPTDEYVLSLRGRAYNFVVQPGVSEADTYTSIRELFDLTSKLNERKTNDLSRVESLLSLVDRHVPTILGLICLLSITMLVVLYRASASEQPISAYSAYPVVIIAAVVFVYVIWNSHRFASEQRRAELAQSRRYTEKLERMIVRSPDGRVLEPTNGYHIQSGVPGGSHIDASEYMTLNLQLMRDYYLWSQRQAKHVQIMTEALCVAGFALIAVGVVVPVVRGTDVSVASVVGGAVTEALAATCLYVYQRSLAQLNYYHQSLHEDERFLTSVNMLDRFDSAEQRNRVLERLIDSEIEMNLKAARQPEQGDRADSSDGGSEGAVTAA